MPHLPPGQALIYSLASVLLPAAKQRPTHKNDRMTSDAEIACPDPHRARGRRFPGAVRPALLQLAAGTTAAASRRVRRCREQSFLARLRDIARHPWRLADGERGQRAEALATTLSPT